MIDGYLKKSRGYIIVQTIVWELLKLIIRFFKNGEVNSCIEIQAAEN